MNLWIFNQYAISPDLPGGTRHHDLGRELVQRGHRVVIIAASFHHHIHEETRLKPREKWKVEDINGVQFVWLRTPHYWRNDWRRVWNMVVYAQRAWWIGRKLVKTLPEIGKPDIVIGSSPHLLIPLAAYRVARYYHVPFLMEVRDLWPQTIIDMGGLGPKHPITRILQALEQFLYQRAERIITVLPLAHEYITALGIPKEKVVWIPNGVDLTRFTTSRDSSSVTGEGFKVMYLGAHGKANALDVLIQAAKLVQDKGLREIKFILAGDGPEKPRLMTLAQKLGLQNVEFRPPVPKDKVANTLLEADAFVFNLEKAGVFRYGVSANKLFDYMAAAKPVVFAADVPNDPVQNACCVLAIRPRDPQAMAEAVIKLYQMPKQVREAIGRRGREYVEEFHNIAKLAERLEQTLQQIVNNRQ